MNHSESITKLAAALAKAQGEMENADKSSNNPFFGSKYADLAEIINTARPVLARHGLSIVQFPGFDGSTVTVENVLMHESGEWLSGLSGSPMPVMTKRDGTVLPPSPQGIGSAITYLRRYSMAALCMIAQEDDDGNAASKPPARPAEEAPPKARAAAVIKLEELLNKAANANQVSHETESSIRAVIDEGDEGKVERWSKWLVSNGNGKKATVPA